ncbi:hypothetical protein ACFWNN_40870 [Lentzea sp. NPDC058450]|uniref:hypothetical protein n=1 Tax=Lentzea sp. NPDC058450 TaxID=3346505 RepID=UPI00365144B5
MPTDRIVAEIRDTATLSPDSLAFLAAAPVPVAEVRLVLDGLTDVSPQVTADFVTLCADDRQVSDLLGYALDQTPVASGANSAEKWLLEVHELVDAKLCRGVVRTGLVHFQRRGQRLPPSLRTLALRTDADSLDAADIDLWHEVYVQAAAALAYAKKRADADRDAPAHHAEQSMSEAAPLRHAEPLPHTPTPTTPQVALHPGC